MIHYVSKEELERAKACLDSNGEGFFTIKEQEICKLLKARQPVHALTPGGLYNIQTESSEYPRTLTATYICPSETIRFHRFKTNGATPEVLTIHENAILSPATDEATRQEK